MLTRTPHARALPKFGDEIRLMARSAYTKKPKPAWLDPTGAGWTEREVMAGPLGVYEKQDGSKRVMVPPKGDLAGGTYKESYYRVEDVLAGVESHGQPVKYGDSVALVDENGHVWNNKTGGLFYDGYLTPAPKGAPGEMYVTFRKNGKERCPMEYGDVGVFVDVVDSHRHRGAFNNRLTNYKSPASNVVGGYVCCDGSGELLPLIVQRYQGRIKPRQSAFSSPQIDSKKLSRDPSVRGLAPALNHISVVTSGVRDVMRVAPAYGADVILYNVVADSQVELEIEDGSTAVVDGAVLLGEQTSVSVVTHGRANARGVQLVLEWRVVDRGVSDGGHDDAPAAKPMSAQLVVVRLARAAVLLCALYFGVLVFMRFGLGWEHKNRRNFVSLFVCWLAGLVTPAVARQPPERRRRRAGATVSLQVRYVETVPDEDEAPSMDQFEPVVEGTAQCAWSREGWDDKLGMPHHPAFVRFLNGEQGNMQEALRRWQVTCEWRAENAVDQLLDSPHRLFFLIKAHYPHYFLGRSKYGHVVYMERVGGVNMSALRRGGAKLRDMIHHYIYSAEFQWTILEPTEYGRSLTILDAAGIGFFDFAGDTMEFIKKATNVVQEHYPERGFMVFVINVPYWFTSVWAIVKTWVNPRTLNKIRILGKDYQQELFKFVDPSVIPMEMGGTGKVPLGESAEEKMFRNNVVRVLLRDNSVAIGGSGEPVPRTELEKMIDPSVDPLVKVSRMNKTDLDGELVCDASGRPVIKVFT